MGEKLYLWKGEMQGVKGNGKRVGMGEGEGYEWEYKWEGGGAGFCYFDQIRL